nr:cyclin-dependent kinase 4-like isoform X2 [Paramormyrops kingsleyae]
MEDQLAKSSADYEILVEIGEGAYGKVYKARAIREPQRLVAVKKLNIPVDSESGIPAFMIREVALLKKIEFFNHPNIVKLLNVSATWKKTLDLTLVFEYVDQDLSTFLAKAPQTGLSREMIKGLDFLHVNMLVHRDLKPANVLISGQGRVKIADFGLARIYTSRIALTPCVVTLWYRAPEVLLHSSYTSSVDMWSAGCIFAEFFLLRPLFCCLSEVQQLQKIIEVIGLPPEEDWPAESAVAYSPNWAGDRTLSQMLPNLDLEENELLLKLLTFNPLKRIPASKALEHPFFKGP